MPSWKSLLGAWFGDKAGSWLKQRPWRRFLAGLVLLIAFSTLTGINFLPENLDIKEGSVAPKDIPAFRSVVYQDKIATEALRKAAADRVLPVYDLEPVVVQVVENNIESFIEKVRNYQQMPNLDETSKVTQIKSTLPFNLNDQQAKQFLLYNQETLNLIEESARQLVRQVLTEGVEEDQLNNKKEQLIKTINELPVRKDQRESIKLLTTKSLQPNKIRNNQETKRSIQAARDSVIPVTQTILRNQKIISKGELVTKDHIQKLEALGLLRASPMWRVILGIGCLVLISMALVLTYIRQFLLGMYQRDNLLILLGIIVFITLLVARGVFAISFTDRPEISELMGYLVPISAGSMLIAVLLNSHLAIVVTIVLNIWLGVLTGFQLRFALVGIVTGLVAIYSVSHLSQRSDLAKAGLINVGVSAAVTIASIGLITGIDISLLTWGLVIGLGNGILSAVLTGGVLPYLESAFGITSAVRMLELSNPNNPLLKRMLMEAPGTYHHSIIVGNMAETAADAIGADSLLVRAGAYYHDIGKTKRPYFFIENQLTPENPHDKIAPSLSTLIITSHIRDGVEMAREHKLSERIIDIIEQHHGTSLVSYFYHRAKETDKHESVQEEDYRYDGPKPQTREAALVMLADSVEAGVRSQRQPSLGDLEGYVREIIKKKLEDGQLDECNITLRDLHTIANAFMKVLTGIFHSRVEYPDQMLREMERRKLKDANLRQ
jgi:putative nucleotidyltransferase with HDIG domain